MTRAIPPWVEKGADAYMLTKSSQTGLGRDYRTMRRVIITGVGKRYVSIKPRGEGVPDRFDHTSVARFRETADHQLSKLGTSYDSPFELLVDVADPMVELWRQHVRLQRSIQALSSLTRSISPTDGLTSFREMRKHVDEVIAALEALEPE